MYVQAKHQDQWPSIASAVMGVMGEPGSLQEELAVVCKTGDSNTLIAPPEESSSVQPSLSSIDSIIANCILFGSSMYACLYAQKGISLPFS